MLSGFFILDRTANQQTEDRAVSHAPPRGGGDGSASGAADKVVVEIAGSRAQESGNYICS